MEEKKKLEIRVKIEEYILQLHTTSVRQRLGCWAS
jgi:hypothetical protein